MRTIDATPYKPISIGKTHTNNTLTVRFDVSKWLESYPSCTIELTHRRPCDKEGLPVSNFTVEDNYGKWIVSFADTAFDGQGECELCLIEGDAVIKSITYETTIEKSIAGTSEEPPEPYEGWVDAVLSVPGKVPYINPSNKHWMKYDINTESFVDTGVSAKGDAHIYASLERQGTYLYDVTFNEIPEYTGGGIGTGGCSAYVRNGKLYRNFDWFYDNAPTFHVICKGFEGMAVDNNLVDGEKFDEDIMGQLPYRLIDGRNDNGIMMSTHILFNDFEWSGSGARTVPLAIIPYKVLTLVKSMDTIETDLADTLANLYANEELGDYLIQCLITDGETTYALIPPNNASGNYTLVDATDNPKMTNFRWVNQTTVDRSAEYMQKRPTGVERWNEIETGNIEDLRFIIAYEEPTRLSEFIGIDDTDKDSTDEELEAIYNLAHAAYLTRTRDGSLWQTMHSVVYKSDGIDKLNIQENWDKDYSYSFGNKISEPVNEGTAGQALVTDGNGGRSWATIQSGVQSDWSQNDASAADYVKNRIAYAKDPIQVDLLEGFDFANYGITVNQVGANEYWCSTTINTQTVFSKTFGTLGLEDGDCIDIFVNDVSYHLKVWIISNANPKYPAWRTGGPEGSICFGNPYIPNYQKSQRPTTGEEYDDVDFLILVDPVTNYLYFSYYLGSSSVADDSYEFNLFGDKIEYVTLNKNYINIDDLFDGVSKLFVGNRNTGSAGYSFGDGNTLSGSCSFAEGIANTASGIASHVEGGYNESTALYTHAEGYETKALSNYAHSEGCGTKASGMRSHSEGNLTVSSGDDSHAEGQKTTSSGSCCHTEGYMTTASNSASHAEGSTTNATGLYSHSEGGGNNAKGEASHAEGYTTEATKIAAHSEGYYTVASGEVSHAEGGYNTASGACSHAEGGGDSSSYKNTASGEASHAEGQKTQATNTGAHAEGIQTIASGIYSHAEGSNSTASGSRSHAEGSFCAAEASSSHAEGSYTQATSAAMNAHVEGAYNIVSAPGAHAEGGGYDTGNTASGTSSHAEGECTIASGSDSHAEGGWTTASGAFSHAEGVDNIASGQNSHAEGDNTEASGKTSHSEGANTIASGMCSHAEGSDTVASAYYSHVEGLRTKAVKNCQHVSGKYNIEDTTTEHAVIVGNGRNEATCSNAYTLDWNGKGEYASDVVANAFGSSPVSLVSLAEQVAEGVVLTDQTTSKHYKLIVNNGILGIEEVL